jgi:hypothetical protein
MWLQTKYGFYSVIEHRDDVNTMMVRARCREDLEALCDEVAAGVRRDYNNGDAQGFDSDRIVFSPDADYHYRLIVPRAAWMEVALRLMTEIDYPNFKSAVGERDKARADLYHDVWATLYRIQSKRGGGYFFDMLDDGDAYPEDDMVPGSEEEAIKEFLENSGEQR